MTKHTKPTEFFTGGKKGIFLEEDFIMELIRLLQDYPALSEERESLKLAASSSMADDIAETLARHKNVSHETKADALRIALGQLVESE